MMQNHRSWRETAALVVLGAIGGLSSVALSRGGPALCSAVPLPGGTQALSGLHVLPLLLVAGLVRRPGAATLAGLLKGVVEMFAGSSHGLLVLIYAGLAGIVVDLVLVLARRRSSFVVNLLAGGLGSASNIAVLVYTAGFAGACRMTSNLGVVTAISFGSGVVLAGALGSALLATLDRSGITQALLGSSSSRLAAVPGQTPESER
jgi:ABC-type thiamin/hydroxymethylpyrimidine transport system permease subunit